jgi:sorting nexin-8
MSLFGDDGPAPTSTPSRRPQSASLFDNPSTPSARNSTLFADDDTHQATNDYPWGFTSSKRAAQSTLVKTLLPAGDVPEAYVDVYDRLLADEDVGAAGVSGDVARKVLKESSVDDEAERSILKTVGEGKVLGRGEVNMLLALIGLAQEGEEVTLDGVDERRKSTCLVEQSEEGRAYEL